jgi:hypothetical protein
MLQYGHEFHRTRNQKVYAGEDQQQFTWPTYEYCQNQVLKWEKNEINEQTEKETKCDYANVGKELKQTYLPHRITEQYDRHVPKWSSTFCSASMK